MNNYNNNSMNMNEQEEVPMLPPLFRSMNLMAVAPAPQLARETTDLSNKQLTNSIGKEERSSSCTRNVSPTSIVHTTPSTPTWAPVDALRKLSYYHPLDPSHVTVPREDLSEVLDGVSAALRALSCHVTYASDALVATALTMDGVEFQIALWANRGSNNKNNNKRNDDTDIICEMQRIKGDSYTYHAHYAQPILRAVTAHDYSPFDDTNATSTNNKCAGHALDQMQHMPGMTTTMSTATDEDILSALEMAGTMLLSDRYDACLLGMESLECLTQPASVGWQTATVVAQGLTEESAVSHFLWNQLMQPKYAELQYAALKIWVQVWQILAELQHPQLVLPTAEDTVVTLLLQMMQQAATAPHAATLAAQGLTALYQLEQPAVVQRLSYNVQEQQPIQYAAMIGQACHAALAAASGQLLTTVHG